MGGKYEQTMDELGGLWGARPLPGSDKRAVVSVIRGVSTALERIALDSWDSRVEGAKGDRVT